MSNVYLLFPVRDLGSRLLQILRDRPDARLQIWDRVEFMPILPAPQVKALYLQ